MRKRTVLFRHQRKTICPACVTNDSLNAMGRPRFERGMKLTGGCEICGGSGEVTEGYLPNSKPHDPWALTGKTQRISCLECQKMNPPSHYKLTGKQKGLCKACRAAQSAEEGE